MTRVETGTDTTASANTFVTSNVSGDTERARRVRSLNVMIRTLSVIVAVVFTIGIPFVYTNKVAGAVLGSVLALITFAAWLLTRQGMVRRAAWLLIVCGYLFVSAIVLMGGGFGSVAPLGFLAIITTAVWLLGLRVGVAIGLLSAASTLATALAAAAGVAIPRILPFNPLSSWVYLIFVIAASGIPVVFAIRDLEEALNEARRASTITATIIDSMPGIFAKIDYEGRLVRFNARLSEVTGVPPAQLTGLPVRFLIAESEQEAAVSALRQCLTEGSAVQELSLRRADGTYSPHLFYGARLLLDGAQRVVVIGLDLQERRQAEMALRRFEERYRDFLERVRFAAITTDLELKLEFANDYFEKLTGWLRDELIGQPFLQLIESDDVPAAFEHLNKVMHGVEPMAVIQTRLMRKEGRPRVIQWSISPIVSPEGVVRGVTCLGVDFTKRHELEAQLLQSQKLESLGRLAAGVAHDFNNILTIIAGFSEMLQSTSPEPGDRDNALREILTATHRAAALTRQLLAFSRKQVLSPQIVDLNELVLESMQLLNRLIGADIRIQTSLAPTPQTVLADSGQLHQVLMNLAVNARDAMPYGGTLSITTSTQGDMNELVVGDSGHGMDAETLERAFEPFFTTKEPGQGSGLGLAMVYGIVEQSRGSIAIESSIGRGTTVTIRLPAVEGKPLSVPQSAGPGERRPIRILLVEDEPGVRNLVTLLLKDAGHSVIPAEDGPGALEEAERASFDFDAAVVDVVMPYMTGPELVMKLRQHRPDLPVVFISGYSHTPPVEIQGVGGHTEYVQKPFRPEELFNAIDHVLPG